jgi:transposase
MSINDKRWITAYDRTQLVLPLVNDSLDSRELSQLRKNIAMQAGVSVRTIQRYEKALKENGVEGLLPKSTPRPGKRVLSEEIVDLAENMLKENPKQSLLNIIKNIELKLELPDNLIKKSTLYDQLKIRGITKQFLLSQLKIKPHSGIKFVTENRNDLWLAAFKQIKYFDTNNTYLIFFIDDATRYVVHSEFVCSKSIESFFTCFRDAIEMYGAPTNVHFEIGAESKSPELLRACSILGIHILDCKPYIASSKAKIRSFHRFINSFINELHLIDVLPLTALNDYWSAFLDCFYQRWPHSSLGKDSLGEGKTPTQTFNEDKTFSPIVSESTLNDAFSILRPEFPDQS